MRPLNCSRLRYQRYLNHHRVKLQDVPSYSSFGASVQEAGKVLYNEVCSPQAQHSKGFPDEGVFNKGIFVGYRGYEIKETKPLFAFGFGLSYTSFAYTDLQISSVDADGSFSLTFKLTNTGPSDGKEVAQVYIADGQSSLPRPVKELKAFAKAQIKAGESQEIQISLTRDSLGFYDSHHKHWVAEKGSFVILVGSSSDNLALCGEITLPTTMTWTGL